MYNAYITLSIITGYFNFYNEDKSNISFILISKYIFQSIITNENKSIYKKCRYILYKMNILLGDVKEKQKLWLCWY